MDVTNELRDKKVLIPQLLGAIRDFHDRGLLHGSKWLCQLLESLPSSVEVVPQDPPIDISSENTRFLLARSYFDRKEYKRASYALNACTSQKSQFLRLYSLFLAGEKRKQEDAIIEQKRPHEHVLNLELAAIREELCGTYSVGKLDGLGVYLYGIVMRECWDPSFGPRTHLVSTSSVAKFPTPFALFIEAVNQCPWNWSAWLDLAEMIHDSEIYENANQATKPHILKKFWQIWAFHRLGLPQEALKEITPIKQVIPSFTWLLRVETCALANLEQHEAFFRNLEKVRLQDPHGLELLDHMASVLKQLDKMDEVCKLAMEATATSKWTYESCSVVARFHQMQGAMEMAQTMFSMAIELNPQAVDPWMGLAEVVGQPEEKIDKFRMAEAIAPFNESVKAQIGSYYIQWSMLYAYYYLYHASKRIGLPKHPVWDILIDFFQKSNMRPLAKLLNDNLAKNASETARKTLFLYLQQASLQPDRTGSSIQVETPVPHHHSMASSLKTPTSTRGGTFRSPLDTSPGLVSPTGRLFPPSPFSPTRTRPSQRSSAASMSFEYADEGQEMAMGEEGVEQDDTIVIESGAQDILLPGARQPQTTQPQPPQPLRLVARPLVITGPPLEPEDEYSMSIDEDDDI